MAKYGIRVAGATNTLVAWKPKDFHGTSLQKVDPADEVSTFWQTGLAIVTSPRIIKVWQDYQRGLDEKEELAAIDADASDVEYME